MWRNKKRVPETACHLMVHEQGDEKMATITKKRLIFEVREKNTAEQLSPGKGFRNAEKRVRCLRSSQELRPIPKGRQVDPDRSG